MDLAYVWEYRLIILNKVVRQTAELFMPVIHVFELSNYTYRSQQVSHLIQLMCTMLALIQFHLLQKTQP